MKKIILMIAVFFAVGSSLTVSAQQTQTTTVTRVKYYYYPTSNIYYDPVNNEYWYFDDASTTWMEVQTLPTTIIFTKTPKYTVYYNGKDVWKDNATHRKKYKVKDNGLTKTKTKQTKSN